jgi:hypothetical protein
LASDLREARIGDLKTRINALEDDKQDIMHDRDRWRAQAELAMRLLTNQQSSTGDASGGR